VGYWKDNKRNGYGTLTFPDGSSYVGDWKDDQKNGEGTYTSPDDSIYVGYWKDNKRNGYGTYTFPDGASYVGNWENDKMNGYGTYTSPDGSSYVGDWKDGDMDGKGTLTFPDGSSYVGDWENDKRNGYGTYTYTSGSSYVGNWENGEMNGKGTFTFPDGTSIEVNAENNFFVSEKLKINDRKKTILYLCRDKELDDIYLITKSYPNSTVIHCNDSTDLPAIEQLICSRKKTLIDGKEVDGGNQIVIHFSSHGSKDGRLADQQLLEESLTKITGKLIEYNKANPDKKVTRVKLNLTACYGDKYLQSPTFIKLVSNLCENNIEVRTSAILDSEISSTHFFNGKNNLSHSHPEETTIVERLFVPAAKASAVEGVCVWEGKEGKYLNHRVECINQHVVCHIAEKLFEGVDAVLAGEYQRPGDPSNAQANKAHTAITTSNSLDSK